MNKTLNRLIELKKFIDNNPNAKSTKWHKDTVADYGSIVVLKKNAIVKNFGSNNKPVWKWNSIIPNLMMAEKVEAEKKKLFAPTKAKTRDFSDLLFGIEINLRDDIFFTVQRDSARIVRKDKGIVFELKDPSMFETILSLLK